MRCWGLLCAAALTCIGPLFADLTQIPQPDSSYLSSTTEIGFSQLADGTLVTGISDANLGVNFSLTMQKDSVDSAGDGTWTYWSSPPFSESSTPAVLDTQGYVNLTMTLSTPVTIFGFEAEPNFFDSHVFTASFYDGTTLLGSITQPVVGESGALLFAASSDSSDPIDSIVLTTDEYAGGLGIAAVRYQLPVPADPPADPPPASMAEPNLLPELALNFVLALGTALVFGSRRSWRKGAMLRLSILG